MGAGFFEKIFPKKMKAVRAHERAQSFANQIRHEIDAKSVSMPTYVEFVKRLKDTGIKKIELLAVGAKFYTVAEMNDGSVKQADEIREDFLKVCAFIQSDIFGLNSRSQEIGTRPMEVLQVEVSGDGEMTLSNHSEELYSTNGVSIHGNLLDRAYFHKTAPIYVGLCENAWQSHKEARADLSEHRYGMNTKG